MNILLRFALLRFFVSGSALVMLPALLPGNTNAAEAALIGWSDEGLHETDGSDVSVYSLLPPYNTIHAQLILGGMLATNDAGITVTYEAIPDANGSMNSTSFGKGNFYDFAEALYGVPLLPDEGLAGFGMPGLLNEPRYMTFDPAQKCFTARGIPITPYDDQGLKNYYPMMRLVARNDFGDVLASTDITLPVTDEKNCRACHSSGSGAVARPHAGWAWDCDPDRDYKLNILRNHDDHYLGSTSYSSALSQAGYNSAGLSVTVIQEGRPVLCIRCHLSNALPGSGIDPVRPLTQVMHIKHSFVYDPDRGVALNLLNDSSACFRCHAGPETRFLRGIHHSLTRTNGQAAMQCQSCHGKMTDVGRPGRQGWLDEPKCQSCHTGTAASNNGQIRYTSSFDASGRLRQAVDQTFATRPNTPSNGLASFRFSHEHGGLACAACHGSAHAEWSSSQPNENVQSQQQQGNAGVLLDCTACHTTSPVSVAGGPHGMHSVNQYWAENHHDLINDADVGNPQCRVCHGTDYRGTVLSRAGTEHTFSGRGTHHYWPGYLVGCYDCHAGPARSTANTNGPAFANDLATNTTSGTPVALTLPASDPANSPLVFRLISPPANGRVTLNGSVATYFPEPGFVGSDSFAYAAFNGSKDSNLGQVDLTVDLGDCVLTASAAAPVAAFPNWSVPFRASAALTGCASALTYDWDFGDGAAHAIESNECHSYSAEGVYAWTLIITADGVSQITNGFITISPTLGPPLAVTLTDWTSLMQLSWLWDPIPVSLEATSDLKNPNGWQPVLDPPFVDFDSVNMNIWVYALPGQQYFRLRRVP